MLKKIYCAFIYGFLLFSSTYASSDEVLLDDFTVEEDAGSKRWYDALAPKGKSYILEPIAGKNSSVEKMLIIVPGGKVPNQHYLPIAEAIQKSVDFNLWVGIVSCKWTADLCNPIGNGKLSSRKLILNQIDQVSKKAGRAFKQSEVFVAGHSLGGQSAFLFANQYPNLGGVLLWASYVSDTLGSYSYPILTLGAELNGGLTKPVRLAKDYGQFLDLKKILGERLALQQKPVIILPKINHSDFSPGFAVPGDLMSEATRDEAISMIAETSAAYMNSLALVDYAKIQNNIDILKSRLNFTESLVKPYLDARDKEESGQWCKISQEALAGQKADGQNWTLNALIKDSTFAFMRGHNHVEYDHKGVANIDIVSHTVKPLEVLGFSKQIAPYEVACKMYSREKLEKLTKQDLDSDVNSCQELNQLAFNYARKALPARTWDRFLEKGKSVVFEEDRQQLMGPQFVFGSKVEYKYENDIIRISSPVLETSVDSNIYPGRKYCKILPVSRAMEIIMTDALPSIR